MLIIIQNITSIDELHGREVLARLSLKPRAHNDPCEFPMTPVGATNWATKLSYPAT